MEINEKTGQLIALLENEIGSCCYNGNSYNGYTGEYGSYFRYPVTYINKSGDEIKTKYDKADIDYSHIKDMRYKFGSNDLRIGTGLVKVLELLEKRYGLDFTELTKNDKKEDNDWFNGFIQI